MHDGTFVERSLTGRRWVVRESEERLGLGIAQRLGLPEVVGRLLAARGVDLETAGDFLTPTLRALMPDPSVLVDMDVAADRLAHAVQHTMSMGPAARPSWPGCCVA
jgi:single-stranded-DNA-specific exonuclease